MVVLYLIERTDKYVRYRFVPQDKYEEGIVQLDILTGDMKVIQESQYELAQLFMGQVFGILRKMYRENKYPETVSRTWG